MRFIAWQPCDEEVMRLAFRCVVRNGIRRFQFAEPANDPQALRRAARMAREEGVEEIVVGLTYSISPVHTHAYYAERVAALADCADIDRFYLKDPGGLLTTDAVRELAPHFVATGRTVELHSHCTIGLAPLVYMAGLDAGFHVLHTAVGPAGNGTSQPTVESTLRNLEAEGYAHALDIEALAEVSDYFRELVREKRLPPGAPREYDAAYYHHQLPGGMVTTTRRMLDEIGRPELFDAVLEEVVRVRAEMGYPILVTPVSQFVRYAGVPQRHRRRALDHRLGRDRSLLPRPLRRLRGAARSRRRGPVLSLPKVESLRDAQPVSLEGARARFGARISDEELLLRLTMPQEQVDAMRAAPPIAERHVAAASGGRHSARPAAARGRAAPVDLVPPRPEGRRPGGVAPCVLRTSAGSSSTSTGRSSTGRADEVHAIPGAREVLDRIAASGRPFAVFTNGSHVPPDAFARAAARGRPAGRGRAGAHAAVLGADATSTASAARPTSCRSRPSPRARTCDEAGVQLVDGRTARTSTPSSSRTPTRRTSSSSSARRAP